MRRVNPPTRTLTDRQRYLIQRLPGQYDLAPREREKEPTNIRISRKAVESWDKKQSILDCQHKKRIQALLVKAREAVYFQPEEKALAIVQQVEKMVAKKCEI